MAKSTESMDYQRLAEALIQRIKDNSEQEAHNRGLGSNWFDELLEALSPLKGLAPARSKLTKDQSATLKDIQKALARTDLANAAAPSPGEIALA